MSQAGSKAKRFPIPIIDLFAGPGGLGEGFTSVTENNQRSFRIALSIEKDPTAHQTLTLRSFLRQFPYNNYPAAYYEFLRGKIDLEELYQAYPRQAEEARKEAWKFEVGDPDKHEQIDKRIRESLAGEERCVLIGGPPCQAYSLVGRARRQEKDGLNKDDERVYLYREYYRILAVHQPVVFVMENVKGLLSSRVDDELIFRGLLADLADPVGSYRKLHGMKKLPNSRFGYRIFSLVKRPQHDSMFVDSGPEPSDFIVRTEEFGIPQTRHRVIILGIREDQYKAMPELLAPSAARVTVRHVLNGLPKLRSGLSKDVDGGEEWKSALSAIQKSGIKSQVDKRVWGEILKSLNSLELPKADRGSMFVERKVTVNEHAKWYLDTRIKGVINHETRSHIRSDLWRYLFVACFGKVNARSPRLDEFPKLLLPDHHNATSGDFANRFKVQLWNEPSKTITSHISKDGHYFIHPDPRQCRSLTVREAARIQTFPDNYFFCGPRTEQFHQVGNAVPPFLAKQIAEIVARVC